MSLLSGGIDSPVAAWRLIRRGCRSHFVHFHSYPILSRTSQDKVRELVRHADAASAAIAAVPRAVRADSAAGRHHRAAAAAGRDLPAPDAAHRGADRGVDVGAHALVTGDAVGQVASQTVDNLAVVGRVATMPILRPLVGMDKEEITRDAQRIGTYETSIIPDEDCCTLFTPRFPATRASLERGRAGRSRRSTLPRWWSRPSTRRCWKTSVSRCYDWPLRPNNIAGDQT